MRSKKGFIKTLESVLTVVVIFGLLTYLVNRIEVEPISQGINLVPLTNTLLESIGPEIEYRINNCDLSRSQFLIRYLIPTNLDSKLIVNRFDKIRVLSKSSEFNTSFFYPFSSTVDYSSIRIFSNQEGYEFNLKRVYDEMDIILSNPNSEEFALLNLNLSIPNPNIYSLKVYSSKRLDFNVTSFKNFEDYTLINLSINPNEVVKSLIVFFTNSTSVRNQSFSSVSSSNFVDYTSSKVVNSSSVEFYVRFFSVDDFEDFFVSYIFDYSARNPSLTSISNITYNSNVTLFNELIFCSPLFYDQDPVGEFFVSKKDFFTKNSVSEVDALIWSR